MPVLLLGQVVALPHPSQCAAPHFDKATLPDTTGTHEVAVGIGESFPGADGFQARRLQRRRLPLRDSKIRHADETDRTGAPRLPPGPLDQVIDILAFLVGQQLGPAIRSPSTT